ncbi:MAG: hypothetical protein V7L27_02650 [Nostoc sp.]
MQLKSGSAASLEAAAPKTSIPSLRLGTRQNEANQGFETQDR